MKRGGDAVGEQLGFGVVQRQGGREIDAGARLDLTLERVAMDIHDAGQHQQAGRVQRRAGAGGADCRDGSVFQGDIGNCLGAVVQQHTAAVDRQVLHRIGFHGSNTICTRGVG